MARPQAKGIHKPKDPAVLGDQGDKPLPQDDPKEAANLAGYAGPDGSKSPGYLQHPPAQDSSGLPMDADDAGRTHQDPGQNSGAGSQERDRNAP